MHVHEYQQLQTILGPTVQDIVQSLPPVFHESFNPVSPASYADSALNRICNAFKNQQSEENNIRIPLPAFLCCDE